MSKSLDTVDRNAAIKKSRHRLENLAAKDGASNDLLVDLNPAKNSAGSKSATAPGACRPSQGVMASSRRLHEDQPAFKLPIRRREARLVGGRAWLLRLEDLADSRVCGGFASLRL